MKSVKDRLYALDGIRGFAILLVIISHLDVYYIQKSAPRVIYQIITGSGVTGVCILFMLSAFLMSTMHAKDESLRMFMRKRYARIFPLFLVMCTITMVVRVFPQMPWYLALAIAIGSFVGMSTLMRSRLASKGVQLFAIFVGLQIVVALFSLIFPNVDHPLVVWLVNMTIAFPFAKNIPMIDGVYWSLCTEILFYLLYPTIFRPFISWLSTRAKIVQWLSVGLIIPLCWAVNLFSDNFMNFSVIRIYLFAYFAVGLLVGHIFQRRRAWVENFQERVATASIGVVTLGLALYVLLFKTVIDDNFPVKDFPLLLMFWAFPFGIVLVATIDTKVGGILTRFFRSRILRFFGSLSYSLYLTHAFVLNLIERNVKAVDLQTNILIIIAIISGSIVLAAAANELIEKQYFMKKSFAPSNSTR